MGIGFIGAGRMPEAMIAGLVNKEIYLPGDIAVTDVSWDRLNYMEERLSVRGKTNDASGAGIAWLAERSDVLIMALKPDIFRAMPKNALTPLTSRHFVVSIMAGVSVAELEAAMPGCPVARVMPNVPMLVGEGASGMCGGALVSKEQLDWLKLLLDKLGGAFIVPEEKFGALTGLSGCGPAYVYMFIEALADGAVAEGLPRDLSYRLAAQTVAGAARMVLETGSHPGALKDDVCSPGGATIAGVAALESAAFRGAVMKAVAEGSRKASPR